MDEEIGGGDVFETAASAFGKGGAESAGYDYIVRGLCEDRFPAAGDVGFGGGEVGLKLGEALLCWWMSFVSWSVREVLVGICRPFDIVDVGMILQVRTLETLCWCGDVAEGCLRHARPARISYTL